VVVVVLSVLCLLLQFDLYLYSILFNLTPSRLKDKPFSTSELQLISNGCMSMVTIRPSADLADHDVFYSSV